MSNAFKPPPLDFASLRGLGLLPDTDNPFHGAKVIPTKKRRSKRDGSGALPATSPLEGATLVEAKQDLTEDLQ